MKHDIITKAYWANRERFADLFNAVFFHGKPELMPEELTPAPNEVSNLIGKRKEAITISRFRDIIMSYQTHGITLAILGLENQEQIHYAMPLRNYLYDGLSYQRQCDEICRQHREKRELSNREFLSGIKKEDRLAPVITIVLYYGEKPWDGARSLHEMLNIPENWKPFVNDYTMHLIEMRKQELIFHHKDNQDLFTLFRILYEQTSTEQEIKKHIMEYGLKHPIDSDVVAVLTAASSSFANIAKESKERGDTNMCRVFDYVYNEGKSEGLSAGRNEGFLEGQAQQIIRIYQKQNLSPQSILKELTDELQISHEKAIDFMNAFGAKDYCTI